LEDVQLQLSSFLQVFERLRRERGSLLGVQPGVVPITGDISRPGLGLNAADRAVLVSSVDIVFHVAATVRFNEKMKQALQTNLGGTNSVMQLCKDMHQLKVGASRPIVHSTHTKHACAADCGPMRRANLFC
jgi:nucleoside-diphosphate-sugar epimerase